MRLVAGIMPLVTAFAPPAGRVIACPSLACNLLVEFIVRSQALPSLLHSILARSQVPNNCAFCLLNT